ncbi:MAG: ATP-binding cassette domain-containing protein [Rhizobiales bacterium]|nr:ATP-binding cassette domain-containing protein [Hyphomicrobiales bacterium]
MSFASEGRGLESGRMLAGATEARSPKIKPLAGLVPYLVRYRLRVLAALVALVAAALTTLAVPIAVRRMIDFGFTPRGVALIDNYFMVMIALAGLLAAASAMRYYLVITLGERVVADLRGDVFAHLTALSPAFFDRAQSGEMMSRLTADTTQIKSAVGASVSIALRNLVLFIGAGTMMVVTSPRLSAFVLGAIPIIVLPLVAFGRSVRRRSRVAQDSLADASAYAAERIGAVRTMQAFTNEQLASKHYSTAVEAAFTAARSSTLARAILTAIAIFLIFASVVVVLWVGAQDIIAGTITPGRLGQFVLYAVFAAGGLGELSQVWGEIAQASGAAERLFEILAVKPAIKIRANPIALPQPPRGEVVFDNVRFAYPARPEALVLNGVSFKVRSGERVAIVGPSGAGKSTIFHLILRFYDPSSGSVKFDGIPVIDTDPAALRGRIALVPQETAIFAASVRENIGFGRPGASAGEIERAAEMAAATEFIRRLPRGYDTEVGERGVTLSGGQRQRVAIARAILREAPLLLLDEATSSLDAENETLVQAALGRLMAGRTTLVIAHRLATVLSCDRILVIDHGRIVEEGTHEQLANAGGLYARLAKLQFEGG